MNRKGMILGAVSLGLAAGLGYAIRALASGIPASAALTYAGELDNAGGPVTGTHSMQVTLYDAATAGNVLCQSASTAVQVANGHFSVQLPDACTTAVGANANVWVDVTVDSNDTGRTKIGAVPYAVEANHTPNADTATNATTAMSAANAADGGGIASAISSLQSTITAIQGQVAPLKTLVATTEGTLNYGTTQVYWQGGSYACTGASICSLSFSSPCAQTNGVCGVPFNSPFPHGVLTVLATQGDITATTPACQESSVSVPGSQWSLKGFEAITTGCSETSVEVIQWLALGW